jgi:transposase-like protein
MVFIQELRVVDLKLQVVSACAQPGASIAAVAMQHGINANIVHRWLREHSQGTLINRPRNQRRPFPLGTSALK